MRIGLYTVLSLLVVIATAVGVYLINPNTYSFEIFGVNLPKLPIAVWVALPVALLALFSIIHMFFYSTKNYFKLRKLKADAKRLEDGIYWSLIKEPTVVNFANEDMKSSASLLSESYLEPVSVESSDLSEKIKDTAKAIFKINSGEYVDLKSQKFIKHLSEENPIRIKNSFNQLESDASFALKVIDSKDSYPQELVEKALDKAVATQDLYTLKKYAKALGKGRFFKLLERVENGEEIGLNKDLLKSFIGEYDLDCKDYYKIARVALKSFEPDDNLELFKELASEDEKALPSYLYLLFKYEMLDRVKELLDSNSEDELKAFRAFYALKKSKYNYKIDDIVTIENLCK